MPSRAVLRPAPARAALSIHHIALIALVLASTLFKTHAFHETAHFAPEDDTGLFWSESAFHYRYARAIANGEPVPSLDREAQRPEGIVPMRELTMGMEFAAGLSYRALRPLLADTPFHVYLVAFISFWSSLSIGAAYFAGRALWGSATHGLVAAAAYALSPLSVFRTVGNFLREDFALPFLFLAFGSLVSALGRRDDAAAVGDRCRSSSRFAPARFSPARLAGALTSPALLSGIALAVGVSTWHLSRFYLLVYAVLLGFVVCAGPPRLRPLLESVRACVAALAAAGLLVPVLRAKRFLLSPGFLVLVGLLIVLELASRRAARGAGLSARALFAATAAAVALALVGARLVPSAEGEYSHATGLFFEKLRFLGRKPDDPGLLSEDARVFWVGPFGTPALGTILLAFSTMLLWAPAAFGVAARAALRRRLDPAQLLALLLGHFFAGAALLIERMSVFLIFFAAILAPCLFALARPSRRRAILVGLAFLALYEAANLRTFGDPNPWRRFVESRAPLPTAGDVPNFGNNARVVAWMRRHVPNAAVVLSWFPAGPMVLTDARRPVNLHSMFESSGLRAKERRMREALYGTEEELYALCREWESDYVLYEANLLLDTSKESYRYMADRMRVRSDCAAALLHFHPEKLARFTPVYQDSYYRLFRVRRDAAELPAPTALPYEEIFDPALLGTLDAEFPDDRAGVVVRRLRERMAEVERGVALEAAGRASEAQGIYRRVLERSPDASEARLRLALLALGAGRADEARAILERALATRPEVAELRYALGETLEKLGRRDEAIAQYREALAISPAARPARVRLRALTGRAE